MKPSYAPAVRVRYFTDTGSLSTKTYDYLVPDFVNHYWLKPGEYVVVHAVISGKPEICQVVDVMPHGSCKASKPILGTASLPGLAVTARRREREEVLAALAECERAAMSDPLVRYQRLAAVNATAAALYQRLAQLQD